MNSYTLCAVEIECLKRCKELSPKATNVFALDTQKLKGVYYMPCNRRPSQCDSHYNVSDCPSALKLIWPKPFEFENKTIEIANCHEFSTGQSWRLFEFLLRVRKWKWEFQNEALSLNLSLESLSLRKTSFRFRNFFKFPEIIFSDSFDETNRCNIHTCVWSSKFEAYFNQKYFWVDKSSPTERKIEVNFLFLIRVFWKGLLNGSVETWNHLKSNFQENIFKIDSKLI